MTVYNPALDPDFTHWAQGYGVIHHQDETRQRILDLTDRLVARGLSPDRASVYRLLAAADRVAAMGCWLVGHLTYARHVHLDGSALAAADFKLDPQGHTGGSLNMVPGYVGYLAANALTKLTRGWLMGQGHCVAAIDAVNVLVRNLHPEQDERYPFTDAGLNRLCQDFYHYRVGADGQPVAPLGSHVNAWTAGGVLEGGYLGFADLQYVHMPLPGERLVAFLSDGAYEEQRGADWAARWWRAEDSGLAVPVMIANGRRIDQRTLMSQMGGVDWLCRQLTLNGFAPLVIDGTDPAAFVWAILEAEERLQAAGQAVARGEAGYPVALPYVIAEAPKGYGFPNAGTNLAHGTPLADSPFRNLQARDAFHDAVRRLWVAPDALADAVARLNSHNRDPRPRERDHALTRPGVPAPTLPVPAWHAPDTAISPMAAVDGWLDGLFAANPDLRPRVGNPDELRSNKLDRVLDRLQHRVTAPEPGNSESLHGAVVTALNEEATVCAALANKGGLNLVVSYEAFAVKMLGALRQEIIFSRHQREAGRPPAWISVPVIATSHTWENGKNEQSHQDPTLGEALLGEMGDVARVLFPADANSAVAALRSVYASRGVIATLVIPKQALPVCLSGEQAERLARDGALAVVETPAAEVELVAVGAYQLQQALKACARLNERGLPTRLVYLQEPGRFRQPRDDREATVIAPPALRDARFRPGTRTRVFISHTRPEPLLGAVRPLDLGPAHTSALGYRNRGGTLDTDGLLYANGCTWAHLIADVGRLHGRALADFLTGDEALAVQGRGDPYALIPAPHRKTP